MVYRTLSSFRPGQGLSCVQLLKLCYAQSSVELFDKKHLYLFFFISKNSETLRNLDRVALDELFLQCCAAIFVRIYATILHRRPRLTKRKGVKESRKLS